MKHALLTGGGGAIGVHFIAHFLTNTDWHITIIDSFRHKGYKDRIVRVIKDHPDWRDRLTVIQHDLVYPFPDEMVEQIGSVDYIFHLAALSDVFWGQENPVYMFLNNVTATIMLLEYARKVQPEVFWYFSTDEVYGPVLKDEAHKEWSTHRPSNTYAASKAACEDVCHSYWRGYDVPVIISNTMNNFGEMQAPSKFPAMIQHKIERGETVTIHGNEEEIGSRFYIHSRNAADAVLYIINNFPVKHHLIGELDEPDRYHIVGDTRYTNLELAQTIAKLMDKPLKYELKDFHKDNPAHDIHYGLQDNKLRPHGWKQPTTTEDSLKSTIDWQQGKEYPEDKEWLEAYKL